jgi:small neutral amino acid transporter SnatA (MarC family)
VRVELSIVFTLLFLVFGALLVSAGDLTQSVRIIGGAALLAVGLTMPMVMKKNRKWKKPSRHSRHV